MMKARHLMVLIVCSSFAVGCASFSELTRQGVKSSDCSQALTACEAFLERRPMGRQSDRMRFQVAMTYLQRNSADYDVARARGHLWKLAGGGAADPWETGANRVLELVAEVEKLEGDRQKKSAELERLNRDAEDLRQRADAARDEIETTTASARYAQEELQALRAQLRGLREENDEQQQRIERLTRELRLLKRIDTRQKP